MLLWVCDPDTPLPAWLLEARSLVASDMLLQAIRILQEHSGLSLRDCKVLAELGCPADFALSLGSRGDPA